MPLMPVSGSVGVWPRARRAAVTLLLVASFVPNVMWIRMEGQETAWAGLFAQLVLALSAVVLWGGGTHRRSALLVGATVVGLGLGGVVGFSELFGGYWNEVGWVAQLWPAATLLPVLLTYPGELVLDRLSRFLVWATALVIGSRAFAAPTWSLELTGYRGPARWATYPGIGGLELSHNLVIAETACLLVLMSGAAYAFASRWVRADGLQRSAIRAVAVAGFALAAALALAQVSDASWPVSLPARDLLSLLISVILGLAPVVLLTIAVRDVVRRAQLVDTLLRHGGDAAQVETTLRTALRDPRLRLHFAVAGGWADAVGGIVAAGFGAAALPPAEPGLERRPLPPGDPEPKTVVDLGIVSPQDDAVVGSMLHAAALAVENSRLAVESAAHLQELSASRTRVVQAGLLERRRLERDLHDGVQQHLLSLSATLSRAELADSSDGRIGALAEARAQVAETMAEVRRLARGIHPTLLSQGGLAAAIPRLESVDQRVSVEIDPVLGAGTRLDPTLESAAYFVVAEVVANAVKHSGAHHIRATCSVLGTTPDGGLRLVVEDDGEGWRRDGGRAKAGGLVGVRDRVASLGGQVSVEAGPTHGTVVDVWLPLSVGAPAAVPEA